MADADAAIIRRFYRVLLHAYGPQGWWPGDSPTEVVVGAILTQNTNWRNVERAIANLKAARLLSWRALRAVQARRLATLIRPAGYFNIKAKRLKAFVTWLGERYGGSLARLRRLDTAAARAALLQVNGIGPETADSILVYALNKPSFVVDAYTQRVLRRHRLIGWKPDYHKTQALFERSIPRDTQVYNEYHALLVEVAKRHCKAQANCEGCPLNWHPHDAAR
ncbi:MAG: endonuclease [Phycisphaerae bacterium]|nr:MAG: endonuclease III domain-containing protein [Planctomycetia bacterium]GJQ25735.1 MAG: endonuclease [Phycisphaerae bacterium]